MSQQPAKRDVRSERGQEEVDGGGDTLDVERVLEVTAVPRQLSLHVFYKSAEKTEGKKVYVKVY